MKKKEMIYRLATEVAECNSRLIVMEENLAYVLKLLKEVYSCWDQWDEPVRICEKHQYQVCEDGFDRVQPVSDEQSICNALGYDPVSGRDESSERSESFVAV